MFTDRSKRQSHSLRVVAPLRATLLAVLLGVLSGVVASGAHAQVAGTTQNQPSPKLPERLAPATRAVIERLADSLQQSGMPWAPLLYDKAAEGVLKGADDARIIAATRTLARELGTASTLLGGSAPVSDVLSAASALRAGVPLAAAQKIAARRTTGTVPDTRLALSFIILADFAARGVPVDAAVSAVDGLLSRGANRDELAAFRTGVERDLQAGRDARTTLRNRAEGVLRRP